MNISNGIGALQKVLWNGTTLCSLHFVLKGYIINGFWSFCIFRFSIKVLCCWNENEKWSSDCGADCGDFQFLNVIPCQFLVVDWSLSPSGRFIRALNRCSLLFSLISFTPSLYYFIYYLSQHQVTPVLLGEDVLCRTSLTEGALERKTASRQHQWHQQIVIVVKTWTTGFIISRLRPWQKLVFKAAP